MPPVNGVGEPGAGEPHARFEVAGAGKGMTWPRSPGVAQQTGGIKALGPTVRHHHLTCSRPDSGMARYSQPSVIGSNFGRPEGWV